MLELCGKHYQSCQSVKTVVLKVKDWSWEMSLSNELTLPGWFDLQQKHSHWMFSTSWDNLKTFFSTSEINCILTLMFYNMSDRTCDNLNSKYSTEIYQENMDINSLYGQKCVCAQLSSPLSLLSVRLWSRFIMLSDKIFSAPVDMSLWLCLTSSLHQNVKIHILWNTVRA